MQSLYLKETLKMPLHNSMKYGWGLAYRKPSHSKRMGEMGELYSTDGTNNIYVINPVNWEQTKVIPVYDTDNKPLKSINEIEFIQAHSNYIFAN